jgi:uncharacterized protein (TIGR00251 family)
MAKRSINSSEQLKEKLKIPFRETKDGIVIEVKVEPRASKKGIAGVLDNVLKVKLTAPPVEGEANEQLVEVIAEAAGVRKGSVRIIRGRSSKRKTVEIKGVESI